MSKHHFLGSQAVIIKGNKVLLQKRSDVPIWDLPGGEKKRNETLVKCVVREVKEETNLDVKATRYVGHYFSRYWRYHDDTHVFLCKIIKGNLKPNEESTQLRYFLINDLPKDLLWINRQRIFDAVNGKKEIAVTQRITLLKFLQNINYNPITVLKMVKFSASRII